MNQINWKQVFKSPQAVVSVLSATVAVLGTAGILNTNLSSALQSLLMAALGVLTAATHTAVSAKVGAKEAAKQQPTEPVASGG